MELYKEILSKILMHGAPVDTFESINRIIELECYKTLKRIKSIVEDESLSDEDCFMKIEEIVCAFEELGSSGGCRHDFG